MAGKGSSAASDSDAAKSTVGGSDNTKTFYDRDGWKEEGGVLKDTLLFGVREDGPVKQAAHATRIARLLGKLSQAGPPLNLLECGCGGAPESTLLGLCSKYTGVDFSATGLDAARRALSGQSVPFELMNCDMCRLPFPDSKFDAVYSAHAIYHIPDPASQAAAYREALRVTRPGGVALFIMANPYPLLFPIRLVKRIVADMPGVGRLLDALRPAPPLPYKPMSLGWTRRLLAPFGSVSIEVNSIASTWFNQNVLDRGGIGKLAWKFILHAEERHPVISARLGNYVQIMIRKHG